MLFHKLVTLLTLMSFILAGIGPHRVYAGDPAASDSTQDDSQFAARYTGNGDEGIDSGDEKKNRGIIKIVGGGRGSDEGWSIVRHKQIQGRIIIISEKIGPHIDLAERNYYGIFQGETFFKSNLIRPLQLPVLGFKSATFIQLPDSSVAVKLTHGPDTNTQNRVLRLRRKNSLKHFRNFIDHFEEIKRGTYKLSRNSSSDEESKYPQYTDRETVFQVITPFYHVTRRSQIQLTLKDGQQVRGEVVPIFDGESVMLETDIETRKVPVDDIAVVRFNSSGGSRRASNALRLTLSGVLSGALLGALFGWQNNGSVGESVLWGASVLGAFGFISGIISGGGGGQRGGEFTLGPDKDRSKEGKKKKGR